MKQIICKSLVVAAVAFLALPSTLLAQKEKEKAKESKETQHIVITRSGNASDKMIIEVEGDKIKVNGKDPKDVKDIDVHVNTSTGASYYRVPRGYRPDVYNFNHNEDYRSLFDEDENRAMLGVNTDDHEKGARIESLTVGAAAEKAGLKKGDIITRIGDKKIEDANDLTEAIQAHKPGEKVSVAYLRDGKEQKATAELGKWKGIRMNAVQMPRIEGLMEDWKDIEPTELPRAFGQGGTGYNYIFSGRPRLGMSIQDTDESKGVKVLEVEDESNAAKAGIQKDDIILSIDDKEIKGTEDVMKALKDNKEKYNFMFKVQRGGKTQNIEVKFPKKLKKADL